MALSVPIECRSIQSIQNSIFLSTDDRPNVCTERKEEISDWNGPSSSSSSSSNESSEEQKAGLRKTTTSHGIGFHFSFNTCVEKSNKRTCTSV